jgi:hypothetical protein
MNKLIKVWDSYQPCFGQGITGPKQDYRNENEISEGKPFPTFG